MQFGSRRLAAVDLSVDISRHRGLGALGAALDRERADRAWGGPAAVRLRRRDAAADAALARAGPGRRDLPHPLPRRPHPRPAGAAEDLRPDRPRGAADDLRAAGLRDLFTMLEPTSAGSASSSSWSSWSPGEAVAPRRLRGPVLRSRPRRARQRLRAGRGRAPGPLRPRGGQAARRRRRPGLRRAAARRGGRGRRAGPVRARPR